MQLTPELESKIREAFNRAPVDGSTSVHWDESHKEAYQDGMYTILDLLEVEINGISSVQPTEMCDGCKRPDKYCSCP